MGRGRIIPIAVLLSGAGGFVGTAMDNRANPAVHLVDVIPRFCSGEIHQDSEPFYTFDSSSPNSMAISTLGSNVADGGHRHALIYQSIDGGNRWSLQSLLAIESRDGPGDITIAMGSGRRLYAALLAGQGSSQFDVLALSSGKTMTRKRLFSSRSIDQPYVKSRSSGLRDRIYIGNNQIDRAPGSTAALTYSLNGGKSFRTIRLDSRSTADLDGPPVRPAIADDGTVYVAFLGWRTHGDDAYGGDVVVLRDDQGGAGPHPFRDLVDPRDGRAGVRVVANAVFPCGDKPRLGHERVGHSVAVAVSPTDSASVYVAWLDYDPPKREYWVHVRGSNDRGMHWSDDLRTLSDATCFELAVANNGVVALLYQQFVATGARRWVTHLEQTADEFRTLSGSVLADVPADDPAPQEPRPYLGDFASLVAAEDEFRGVFAANNEPDRTHFPLGVTYQRLADFQRKRLLDEAGNTVPISIDPFYFRVGVMQRTPSVNTALGVHN